MDELKKTVIFASPLPALPASHTGPGLVDVQMNGYAGFDFNSDPDTWTVEDFYTVQRALARRGVLRALPTLITDDHRRMIARARTYARLVDQAPDLRVAFPKLHIEGPFISPVDGPRGAHPLAHCTTPRALPDLLSALREASGDRIGILTLAPELPGALALIERATEQGICVALGHTGADAETLARAVEAGARLSTHLGNGSHQVLPRLDNYVHRQLAEDRLAASFIADGHHMPFPTLKNFIRAKTPRRSILITDAIAAADVGPGRYRLGREEVIVSADLRVAQPGRPHLAGSALTLDRAVIHVCLHCDVSFTEAWAMASTQPAALIDLDAPPSITVCVSPNEFRGC